MALRIPVLLLAVACQATSQDVSGASQAGQRGAPSPAIELTVHLIELSQGPAPIGLPADVVIEAPRLPGWGEVVEVVWRALDGDAGPREGPGTLEIDPEGQRATVKLSAPGRAPTAVLTLSGSMAGASLTGKFSDRLFFPRAGRFDGEIREK